MELHGGNILNVRWYNIYVNSLNGIRKISSKENSPPSVRVRFSFRGEEGGGQFSLGATVLESL